MEAGVLGDKQLDLVDAMVLAADESVSDDYLAKMIGNISERNQLYVDFIAELEAVINTAGQDSPVEGVRRLKGIVDGAAQFMNSVRRDE